MKKVSDLKVAVVNFSGNVGKTVVASQLLFPRIKDCEYFHIETINSGSDEGETMAASNFSKLLEGIELSDACVIDVGASNIETFLSQMRNFKNSHDEINYFIIPVTPSSKELKDTEALIDFLMGMGISKNKLKIVFNQVERQYHKPESELDFFNNTLLQNFVGDNKSVIHKSEYYPMLKEAGKLHVDVVADDRDFNAMKKAAETKEKKFDVILEKKLYQAGLSAEDDLIMAFENLGLVGE